MLVLINFSDLQYLCLQIDIYSQEIRRCLDNVTLYVDPGDIMTDLFDKGDVASLLRDKTIVLLGGSVIRGLYKDLVWLLNSNSLIDPGVM